MPPPCLVFGLCFLCAVVCGKMDATHFQSIYCAADFVLKVALKKEVDRPKKGSSDTERRRVVIKTQFKISPPFMNLSDEALEYIWLDKSHPVNLKEDRKYLVAGYVDKDSNLRIPRNLSWFEPWHEVNHRRKAHLHKRVIDDSCACKVTESDDSKGSCAYTAPVYVSSRRIWSADLAHCYRLYSYCSLRASSNTELSCAWSRNSQFNSCVTSVISYNTTNKYNR